ncbi:MAG: hypothetical protein KIG97_10195 [Fibrobacter sp.]|uniref:hypothetical protein n=1 Tax=Fibrobacter sp. TaxID=35828 RepID=UPI0025B92964|nr:hypothetical protein [Fibrobacter sp.]MBS7272715.1 hypothetical protein [Fibrobacter sp.]
MKKINAILSVAAVVLLGACGGTSSSSNGPAESAAETSSAAESSSSVAIVPESSAAESALESSSAVESAAVEPVADTAWNKANLTWYISWPDPGSEECVVYNGCEWAGYFAGLPDQQTEEWVSEHNIISIHEKDWDKYKLKTFRLRQNGRTIDATVYDKCADSDCEGCCTQNAGELGFLIDIESYTCERLSGTKDGCDGVVEWTCLDCE